MDMLPFQLVVLSVCAIGAAIIAHRKGRNAAGWFFAGLLLGLIGIIIVICLPNLKVEEERRAQVETENRRLREQLRQERMKGEAFRQHAALRLDSHDNALGVDTRALGSPLPSGQQAALVGNDGAFASAPGTDNLARTWFYVNGGQRHGPVGEEGLLGLIRAGTLKSETLVWTEGMSDWVPAFSVPELFRYLQNP